MTMLYDLRHPISRCVLGQNTARVARYPTLRDAIESAKRRTKRGHARIEVWWAGRVMQGYAEDGQYQESLAIEMSQSGLVSVDLCGVTVTVRGDKARRHLEHVDAEIARARDALLKIVKSGEQGTSPKGHSYCIKLAQEANNGR